jgi:hypothetical protein
MQKMFLFTLSNCSGKLHGIQMGYQDTLHRQPLRKLGFMPTYEDSMASGGTTSSLDEAQSISIPKNESAKHIDPQKRKRKACRSPKTKAQSISIPKNESAKHIDPQKHFKVASEEIKHGRLQLIKAP